MRGVKHHTLPHYNERPGGCRIDTLIIHSLYALSCDNPFDAGACIGALDEHKVASHYLITRDGEVFSLVKDANRAWHAGESCMPFGDDGRTVVNDFSIGIELIATESSGFTSNQYESLAELTAELLKKHPISAIIGHEHIAPVRKTDPGPLFDWHTYEERLAALGVNTNTLRFPKSIREKT